MREYLAKIETEYPGDEARLREAKEKLELIEKQIQQNRKARLVYRVEPDYTPDARDKQITGTVVLGITVGNDGAVQNVQLKKSLFPSLDESAMAAVRKWRFEPAMKDGQAVSMYIQVEFYFAPDGSGAYREKEQREAQDKEKELRARLNEYEGGRRAERESEEKRNAILAEWRRFRWTGRSRSPRVPVPARSSNAAWSANVGQAKLSLRNLLRFFITW
jgi:TonB family protein